MASAARAMSITLRDEFFVGPKDQERLFKKEYALELIRIAEGDLESAIALKKSGSGRSENICFHAQQSMEKVLMAALCAMGKKVPLVRTLGALIAKLPEESSRPFGYELIGYDDFAAIRCYQEGPDTVTEEELMAALKQAEIVLDWARGIWSKHSKK